MPSNRPNILFLLADDMGAWAMGCAGNSEVQTPNLDRMARHGVRLTNAFCASPVCSPARASLLTGRIPSQHGVHDWIARGNSPGESPDHAVIDYLAGQTTYTEILASHGYTVGLSGKWHLGNAPSPQKGHTFWEVHARGGGPYYGAPMMRQGSEYSEPRYITQAITDHALDFLRGQTTGSPFYLGVHYTAPHSPWDRNDHPAEYFDFYFDHCAFHSVPDRPLHPWQINTAPIGKTPERRRELLSGYYAAITAMDAQIGRLLETLEAADLLNNTLVIFTSDNGMNMGHHGIWGKGNGTYPQNMFDTSVKIPFLLSWPPRLPSAHVSDMLFSHYDFLPSLLGLLDLPQEIPQDLPGSDRSAIWTGVPSDPDQSSEIVIFDEYGPVQMLRTRDWKYVHRFPDGPNELYHLAIDPEEEHNLISQPNYAPITLSLHSKLDGWFAKHHAPTFDGRCLPVTGKGQRDVLGSTTTPLFNPQ